MNVDLVGTGIFLGGTMLDMVDNQKGLDKLLQSDPALADTLATIQRERLAAPQDRTDQLVSDNDYAKRTLRIEVAERTARKRKVGIWSDAMKEEREIEGIR